MCPGVNPSGQGAGATAAGACCEVRLPWRARAIQAGHQGRGPVAQAGLAQGHRDESGLDEPRLRGLDHPGPSPSGRVSGSAFRSAARVRLLAPAEEALFQQRVAEQVVQQGGLVQLRQPALALASWRPPAPSQPVGAQPVAFHARSVSSGDAPDAHLRWPSPGTTEAFPPAWSVPRPGGCRTRVPAVRARASTCAVTCVCPRKQRCLSHTDSAAVHQHHGRPGFSRSTARAWCARSPQGVSRNLQFRTVEPVHGTKMRDPTDGVPRAPGDGCAGDGGSGRGRPWPPGRAPRPSRCRRSGSAAPRSPRPRRHRRR